jgi:hypothetical protein
MPPKDMERVTTELLSDEALVPYLEAGDTITFNGLADSATHIHDQVVRLGYGDVYMVERTKEPPRNYAKASPIPKQKVNTDFYKNKESKLAKMQSVLGPKIKRD